MAILNSRVIEAGGIRVEAGGITWTKQNLKLEPSLFLLKKYYFKIK